MFRLRGALDSGDLPFRPQSGPAGESADVTQLKADVERLYFISEALWRILQDKLGLPEEEILRQIAAIDMEDGRLDGKKAPRPPQPCPKCGRNLAKQRLKCMYCGEFIAQNPFDR